MKKKIFTTVLSFAMIFSLSTMAFADDAVVTTPDSTSGLYGASVTVTSTAKVPTIEVTVPTESAIIINPYKMNCAESGDAITDSIVSTDYFIKNESNVPIAINATTTGTLGENSEAVFATAALKGTETTKSIFCYLEVGNATSDTVAATYETTFTTSNVKQVIVTNKATTKANMVTLAAGDSAATYASYKFFGSAATKPTKAWTSTDTVGITVAFTFTPQIIPES